MQKTPHECTKDPFRRLTYKEGPPGIANGHDKQDAPENLHKGPPASEPEKVEPGKFHLGVGRPWTEPRLGVLRHGMLPTNPRG